VHDIEPELNFDVEALLPEEYVADIGVRLSLYKRLASALTKQQVEDLGVEMEDRFGPPPQPAKSLVHLMRLKTSCGVCGSWGVRRTQSKFQLHLAQNHQLDPQQIMGLIQKKARPTRLRQTCD